jgi:hypothetical protein
MKVSSIVRGRLSVPLKSARKAVSAVHPRLKAKPECVKGSSSSKTASSQGKSHMISTLTMRVGIPQKKRKAQSKSAIHVEVL